MKNTLLIVSIIILLATIGLMVISSMIWLGGCFVGKDCSAPEKAFTHPDQANDWLSNNP